jgi:hypothetical protein
VPDAKVLPDWIARREETLRPVFALVVHHRPKAPRSKLPGRCGHAPLSLPELQDSAPQGTA